MFLLLLIRVIMVIYSSQQVVLHALLNIAFYQYQDDISQYNDADNISGKIQFFFFVCFWQSFILLGPVCHQTSFENKLE